MNYGKSHPEGLWLYLDLQKRFNNVYIDTER